MTSKIHHLVDGRGAPMVVVVSAGQSGDSPMLPVLLDHLSVPRIGPGRPRTTPDRLRGDKAYSARGHRSLLRSRGITTTIPEPADQIANRKRRGSSGGRPPAFDPVDYKNRNHVERSFNHGKQWRGFATRYDKLGIVYRGAAVLNAIIRWLQRLRDTGGPRCCQMVCVSGPSTGRNHDECCDRYDESFEQAVCCRATCFAG